jgi:hypothetical protein
MNRTDVEGSENAGPLQCSKGIGSLDRRPHTLDSGAPYTSNEDLIPFLETSNRAGDAHAVGR